MTMTKMMTMMMMMTTVMMMILQQPWWLRACVFSTLQSINQQDHLFLQNEAGAITILINVAFAHFFVIFQFILYSLGDFTQINPIRKAFKK